MSVSFAPGVKTPAPGVEAPATGVEMPATVSRGRRLIRQATRLTGFASWLLKGARPACDGTTLHEASAHWRGAVFDPTGVASTELSTLAPFFANARRAAAARASDVQGSPLRGSFFMCTMTHAILAAEAAVWTRPRG